MCLAVSQFSIYPFAKQSLYKFIFSKSKHKIVKKSTTLEVRKRDCGTIAVGKWFSGAPYLVGEKTPTN